MIIFIGPSIHPNSIRSLRRAWYCDYYFRVLHWRDIKLVYFYSQAYCRSINKRVFYSNYQGTYLIKRKRNCSPLFEFGFDYSLLITEKWRRIGSTHLQFLLIWEIHPRKIPFIILKVWVSRVYGTWSH